MTVITMHFLSTLTGLAHISLILAAPVASDSDDMLIRSEEDVPQPGGML